ncbi:MAG TPA: ATP-binding protein [Candidatus Omnitrophota bacterium]|nr:ATP-binding protein [Candidatus Omnitrophota bacterium]HQO37696.1 ATP-binding protein [Candidatus Omnitrophota bacterium]HQQ05961.1 ATP-binding protein [Candidatus Omnitrophota bacterium]
MMRFRSFEFKVSIAYACILGLALSVYVAFLFALPADVLHQYQWVFISIPVPLTFLFGYYIGQMTVARVLRPLKQITDTVNNITHEDLSVRVTVERADAELRSLIAAFNDMVSRLEEAFDYITDSSSYIAHELKTPIAIIRGESEFALKKERDKTEYERVISVSLGETKRMLKIIEDLLLLTKMNYQPGALALERLDLANFANILYEQARILAAKKNIAVTTDIPHTPCFVNADELHLRRLFLNLIDNAVKFTGAGGSIAIRLSRDDHTARVSVSDTGIGIEQDHLPKLFDKFFRIDQTVKDSSPSSGLGLSIAQSIAELHKGEIAVSSRPGKGTVFTVSLPVSS